MLGAGKRNHRVRFERQTAHDDGYGNVTQGWEDPLDLGSRWCGLLLPPRFGAEPVEAGRPQASQRAVITVLRDSMTTAVTEADRAVFVAGPYKGQVAQIRAARPRTDNAEIEFDLEMGVAI